LFRQNAFGPIRRLLRVTLGALEDDSTGVQDVTDLPVEAASYNAEAAGQKLQAVLVRVQNSNVILAFCPEGVQSYVKNFEDIGRLTGIPLIASGQFASLTILDPPYGYLRDPWDRIDFETLLYFFQAAKAATRPKHTIAVFNGWQVC
jgi:hypothetical protein